MKKLAAVILDFLKSATKIFRFDFIFNMGEFGWFCWEFLIESIRLNGLKNITLITNMHIITRDESSIAFFLVVDDFLYGLFGLTKTGSIKLKLKP